MRPLAGCGQNCDLWMVVPQARWNLTTIKSQGASGQLMVGEPVFHPPPIEPHLLTIVNSVINAAYTSWLARSVTVLLSAYEFVSVNFVPLALARYSRNCPGEC